MKHTLELILALVSMSGWADWKTVDFTRSPVSCSGRGFHLRIDYGKAPLERQYVMRSVPRT